MISLKVAAVASVIMLVAFSVITVETIDSGGSSMTSTSLTGSTSSISVYSPQNGTDIPLFSPESSFNVSLSITSNESTVYIYDISPVNVSAFVEESGVQVYGEPNITHMNTSLYPYNYCTATVTPHINTTLNITLFVNATMFSRMNTSSPTTNSYYPYLVEILVESSTGASGIAFTLLRL